MIESPVMDAVVIDVQVAPRARQDEVAGWREGVLRLRVRAPPAEGKANEAVRLLVAERLGLPVAAVTVIAGASSRRKRLRVEGLSGEAALSRLGATG